MRLINYLMDKQLSDNLIIHMRNLIELLEFDDPDPNELIVVLSSINACNYGLILSLQKQINDRKNKECHSQS